MSQEIRKYILYAILAIIAVILWNAWEKDYGHAKVATHQVASVATSATTHSTANASKTNTSSAVTAYTPKAFAPKTTAAHAKAPAVTASTASSMQTVAVKTDLFNIKINATTGDIIDLGLVKYPVSLQQPNVPFQLLSIAPGKLYVSQSGLIDAAGNPVKVRYQSHQDAYTMSSGASQLNVVLHGKTATGLSVTKTYTFKRDHYVIDVAYHVTNKGKQTWNGSFYGQITRQPPKLHGFLSGRSYHGASVSTTSKPYEELKYSWLNENMLSRNTEGGWIAIQQQYFLSAWVPKAKQLNHYYSHTAFKTNADGKADNIYTVGFVAPEMSLKPGQSQATGARYYAGPEIAKRLSAIAPGLDLSVDYGWLWILSKYIFIVMAWLHTVFGNWGVSIILVTLIIKLIFYKFSESSYRSMARMRALAPKLKQIKERCGDDKQKLSQETMALYKKEKVNPAGGCLPMLIQIPFFIALYYVLIESVQLRQAAFLWVPDLSLKDPFYILPILVGITMFIQQKISPAPADPAQAKAMMLLPVIFTVLFINFPAGLTLYWFTNNVLTILQQWWVMRRVDHQMAAKRGKR